MFKGSKQTSKPLIEAFQQSDYDCEYGVNMLEIVVYYVTYFCNTVSFFQVKLVKMTTKKTYFKSLWLTDNAFAPWI